MPKIELPEFTRRQWKPSYAGTKMFGIDETHFMEFVNARYEHATDQNRVMARSWFKDHPDPSWSFCKYLIFENVDDKIKTSVIKIDHTIFPYIQSGYSSRVEGELPVLSRWATFPYGTFKLPVAKFVGLALYTRKQLLHEFEADPANKGKEYTELSPSAKYGIVSIQGLGQPELDPMPPVTHLRNALGKEQGGNGQPIDKSEYDKSVDFWSTHILVK